jgi:hypothetical protein
MLDFCTALFPSSLSHLEERTYESIEERRRKVRVAKMHESWQVKDCTLWPNLNFPSATETITGRFSSEAAKVSGPIHANFGQRSRSCREVKEER